MTVGFVMEIQDLRLREEVPLVFNKVLDRLEMRKCFHAKLAVESSPDATEYLVFLLPTVPDYTISLTRRRLADLTAVELLTIPLMHVTNRRIRRDFAVAPRTAGMIKHIR